MDAQPPDVSRFHPGPSRSLAPVLVSLVLLAWWMNLPLVPEAQRIWVADYGVGNQIQVNLAQRQAAAGAPEDALRRLLRSLELEPEALRQIEPATQQQTRLSLVDAQLAGGFAPLHQLCAEIYARLGQAREAQQQSYRARVLEAVDQQFKQGQKEANP